MSENSAQAIWLTQEAYDKLRMELDHLSGPGRAGVTAKIAAAREEGDLSENGGYHAARRSRLTRRHGFVNSSTCSIEHRWVRRQRTLTRSPQVPR